MKYKLSKVSKPVMALAAVAMVGAGFGVAALANADTTAAITAASSTTAGQQDHHGTPGVMGKVTAVTGNIISVSSTNPQDSTSTIYTVDASNAKIMKFTAPTSTVSTSASSTTPAVRPTPATITISDIAVGDTINVRGTLSGTNVAATDIMDGMMPFGHGGGGKGGFGGHGESGTITAVNGSTVTITGKDGTTYTVNAGSAKLEKVSTIAVSDLAVGDTINADGAISGTTINADHIMDGAMPDGPAPAVTASATTN